MKTGKARVDKYKNTAIDIEISKKITLKTPSLKQIDGTSWKRVSGKVMAATNAVYVIVFCISSAG